MGSNLVMFKHKGNYSFDEEVTIYINPEKVNSFVQFGGNVVRIYFDNVYHDVNGKVNEVAKKLGYKGDV
jgi:hypothetical protein